MEISELFDKAINKAGSLPKLAVALGWDKGNLSKWKNGKKTFPAARAAELAKFTGDNAEVVYLTMLEKQADTAFERKLLGKLLVRCKKGAVVLTIAAMPMVTSLSMPEVVRHSSQVFDSEYKL